MAGNKINHKTKGKEERMKGCRGVTQTSEDSEDIDFAVLRKPVPTSITGFAQARKIFDLATEELKDLLSNECDVLYECKVCRNIFRSLANFISHKRVYCKEKFNTSLHGHFVKNASALNEYLEIKRTEEGYQQSLKANNAVSNEDENEDRIPLTKDITAIYEKLTKSKGCLENQHEPQQVVLKKIAGSSVAMFQNTSNDESSSDNMRTQIKELDKLLSKDQAVLQNDGKFIIKSSKDCDNVIQISDDDEVENYDELKCKICGLQFSTQKTLKFHMKYKHVESRLVYPCPDCLEIFSTSWSVYRHLFKVHRKTAAQIRRLRESIQSKAFKINNPPPFYERRKNNLKAAAAQKITEEERIDQENQAWMDNMEGDGELPRCGGCGRSFERRAALAAHTHTCQPRSRALARRADAKKIEIQIRKDYNKGPVTGLTILKPDNYDAKISAAEPQAKNETQENETAETEEKVSEIPEDERDDDEPPMDIDDEDQKSNASGESPEKIDQKNDNFVHILRLPYALQAEKRNLAAFKQKIYTDVDIPNLLCKKCDTKYSNVGELYEHMAGHFKWMRYACKLCNFRHYSFEKLPEHVKVVHKLKGDTDFYHSTVKAIDGTEALIISSCLADSELAEETNEAPETSPESRRPSRCSSDSSRLSDDSSSSNTVKETGRKRKMYQNKNTSKKRKETAKVSDNGDDQPDEDGNIDDGGNSNNSSSLKAFEENSSDLDEIDDKVARRRNSEDNKPVVSRRPVRKRTKPKNEDFEYDLSNLLKMEAQGYRDSQAVTTTKTYQTKKKVQSESPTYIDNKINKDHCGALMTLSKKAIETASAHMRTWHLFQSAKDEKANVFARPMLPRVFSRSDKSSPKKDIDDPKDVASPSKVSNANEKLDTISNEEKDNFNKSCQEENKSVPRNEAKSTDAKPNKSLVEKAINTIIGNTDPVEPSDTLDTLNQNGLHDTPEKVTSNANSLPANVVPIKFRRQSLDLIKNPLINKNINDFSKAGMKTKILVIKPINRNKDGTHAANTPLKFQTIKLKDPSKGSSSSDDKKLDQVMVVKVPKVSRAAVVGEIQAAQTVATSSASGNANSQTSVDKKTDEKEAPETIPMETIDAEIKCDNNSKQSEPNEVITENVAPEIVKETESPKIVEAPA